MDADHDGKISFAEFVRWWAHGDGDMDSKFMKWWFKDAVRRSFKLKKGDSALLAGPGPGTKAPAP